MWHGIKNDMNKLRWDLLPIEAIQEAVKIFTYGVEKYGENTWQDVEPFEDRYFAALMRHLVAWRLGSKIDNESQQRHLSHALVNIIFLLQKEIENDV